LEHEGRPGNERENDGVGGGRADGVAKKLARAEKQAEIAQQANRVGRTGITGVVRLTQQQDDTQQLRQRDHQQEPETATPTEACRQGASEWRACDRRQRHRASDVRQHAGDAIRTKQVANHGAADHRTCAGAERRQHPRGQQCLDAGGERAGHRRTHVDAQAGQQHRTPAEAIRHGSQDQLPRRAAAWPGPLSVSSP